MGRRQHKNVEISGQTAAEKEDTRKQNQKLTVKKAENQ